MSFASSSPTGHHKGRTGFQSFRNFDGNVAKQSHQALPELRREPEPEQLMTINKAINNSRGAAARTFQPCRLLQGIKELPFPMWLRSHKGSPCARLEFLAPGPGMSRE